MSYNLNPQQNPKQSDKQADKQDKTQKLLTQSKVITKLRQTFATDYLTTSTKTIKQRFTFDSCEKCFSTIGNICLYVGTGVSATSTALQLLNQENLSKILLFTSTGFFALSITLLGIAKFTQNRVDQNTAVLELRRNQIGFDITGSKKIQSKSGQNKEDSKGVQLQNYRMGQR